MYFTPEVPNIFNLHNVFYKNGNRWRKNITETRYLIIIYVRMKEITCLWYGKKYLVFELTHFYRQHAFLFDTD